ncbi:MAG: hypothetical protein ACLPQS_13485 [Acidimicrobiales bacterium]
MAGGLGVESAVEVLPDVTGIDRTFHYLADEPPALGTIVRVALHGRRVRGWVVAVGTPVPPGVELRPLIEVVSVGPPPQVVDVCRWAAWRWAGRLRTLLVAASPERVVRALPPAGTPSFLAWRPLLEGTLAERVREALSAGDAVLRLPPADERQPVVEAALAELGERALGSRVLVETREDVAHLAARLRRVGWPVATYPEDWPAAAASSHVVIGTRNAALAGLTATLTLVLNAHSDAYRSERVPTFDARVIAAERARRAGTPVVFVTPCPSVELLAPAGRRLVRLPQSLERAGWGTVGVLDTRAEDPAEGGYPSQLVAWIREAASAPEAAARGPARGPVVCILNRVGRARLLTCGSCRAVQRCGRCGAAQVQLTRPPKGEIGVLICPRCGDEQPAVCPACGSARLRVARPGVARAREQLEAVTGLEVGEVSGPRSAVPDTPVLIGTQAALYRVRSASTVVWLDFDQELLAPRLRAAEEALTLLARSVRLVGGRRRPGSARATAGGSAAGRVVIRTSMPDHEVVRAAQVGDPGLVLDAERSRRELLSLPPYSALALIDGDDEAALEAVVGRLPDSVQASRLGDGYLVRAASSDALSDALAALVAHEPAGWAGLRARVEVDPVDV